MACLGGAIAHLPSDGQGLLVRPAGCGHVLLPVRQTTQRGQPSETSSSALGGGWKRQHQLRPTSTLVEVAMDLPETPKGGDQLQPKLCVTGVDGSPKGRTEVVVLELELIEPPLAPVP